MRDKLHVLPLIRCLLQRKDKFSADTLRADHIDIFIVGLDNLLRDGQAKASPFLILSTREISLVEAVPD